MKYLLLLLVSLYGYGQNRSNQTEFLEAIYFDSSGFKKAYSIEEFKTLFDLKLKEESIVLFERNLKILSLFNNFNDSNIDYIISHSNQDFVWNPFLSEMTLLIDEKSERVFRLNGFNGNDILDLIRFMKSESDNDGVKFNYRNLISGLSSPNRDMSCVYKSIKNRKLNMRCMIAYSEPYITHKKYKD